MSKYSIYKMLHLLDNDELKGFVKHYSKYDIKLRMALKTRFCAIAKAEDKFDLYSEVDLSIRNFASTKSLSSEKEKFLILVFDDIKAHLLDYFALKHFGNGFSLLAGVLPSIISIQKKYKNEKLLDLLNAILKLLFEGLSDDIPVDIVKQYRLLIQEMICSNIEKYFYSFNDFIDALLLINENLNEVDKSKEFLQSVLTSDTRFVDKQNGVILLSNYYTLYTSIPTDTVLTKDIFMSVLGNFQSLNKLENQNGFSWIQTYGKTIDLSIQDMNELYYSNSLLYNDVDLVAKYFSFVLYNNPSVKLISHFEDNYPKELHISVFDKVLYRVQKMDVTKSHYEIIIKLTERLGVIDLFNDLIIKFNNFGLYMVVNNDFLLEHSTQLVDNFKLLLESYIENHFGPKKEKLIKDIYYKLQRGNLKMYLSIFRKCVDKSNKLGETEFILIL